MQLSIFVLFFLGILWLLIPLFLYGIANDTAMIKTEVQKMATATSDLSAKLDKMIAITDPDGSLSGQHLPAMLRIVWTPP